MVLEFIGSMLRLGAYACVAAFILILGFSQYAAHTKADRNVPVRGSGAVASTGSALQPTLS